MELSQKGSQTAKDGFRNEYDIINKFHNWKTDQDVQKWLALMQYQLSKIKSVKAVKLSGYKTDVQIQVMIELKQAIDIENLQVKLVSNPKGFNQVDKRWIDKYVEMWQIPRNVTYIFKRYTGEKKPTISSPKDIRRMFAHEFSELEQQTIIDWLKNNQSLIIADILKGRGKFSAEWMLVAQKIDNHARWILKSMNYCMNFFGNGEVRITEKGNIKIGKITMQRKGGDGGKKTAQMLQFKINPAELFK